MGLKVFISHSVAPRELGIVYAIANEAARRGADPFIPDRDWNPEENVPERISIRLSNSHYLLAIATSFGTQIDWLKREIKEFGKKSNLLIVADKGIKVPSGFTYIRIDRSNPAKTISKVSLELAKIKINKETKELLALLGIAGILFLLISGGKE